MKTLHIARAIFKVLVNPLADCALNRSFLQSGVAVRGICVDRNLQGSVIVDVVTAPVLVRSTLEEVGDTDSKDAGSADGTRPFVASSMPVRTHVGTADVLILACNKVGGIVIHGQHVGGIRVEVTMFLEAP